MTSLGDHTRFAPFLLSFCTYHSHVCVVQDHKKEGGQRQANVEGLH